MNATSQDTERITGMTTENVEEVVPAVPHEIEEVEAEIVEIPYVEVEESVVVETDTPPREAVLT